MKILSVCIRIRKLLGHPLKRYQRWHRLHVFRLQSLLSRGQVEIGKNVKFDQCVIFQGKGKVHLLDNVTLGYELGTSPTLPILLQPREKESIIEIGEGSTLVNGTEIVARNRISIGKSCLIGARCVIIDSDFHSLRIEDGKRRGGKISPVTIGDHVWLGLGVTVLKGVTIGNNATIGACSVVTKDIPVGGIAVGNPTQTIGFTNND